MKGLEQPSSEPNKNEAFGIEHFQQSETPEKKKKQKGKIRMTEAILSLSMDAAKEAISENESFVMTMAEAGELESAKEILTRSAIEKVRGELGNQEDFNKLHDNEQINQLYAGADLRIQHEVRAALLGVLKSELGKAGDDEKKKENLQKLILAIGPADKTLN